MSKQTKPGEQPTSNNDAWESDSKASQVRTARQQFFVAAFTMSWQLAIVVLVPVVGGFKLDEHLDSLPVWTVTGFVIAMFGMAVVVWRQLQLVSPGPGNPPKRPRA